MTPTMFADDVDIVDTPVTRPTFNSLSQADRDRLVTDNIGLARTVASQVARMDDNADADDLFGDCLLHFVESARRWCPADGTPFGGFAAGYARRRLTGRVIDAYAGGRTVRGVDMGAVADRHTEDDAADRTRRPDAWDRELLRVLKPAAREIVEAVVFDGCSPAMAGERYNRAVKDVLLICRNAAETLAAEAGRLDTPDLFDFDAGGE